MNRTNIVVGLAILLCAGSLVILQRQFDAGDHAKAERLVRNMRTNGKTETFEAFLLSRTGDQKGVWTTEITGGCRGVVRVTYTIPGNPPAIYAWDVEIPAQGVHPTPTSPEGERLLHEFTLEDQSLPALNLPPMDAGP